MRRSGWGIPAGAITVIAGLFLLALPLFGGKFYTHVFIQLFLNVTLAVGMRLLYVTGQVSFCHVTFYAIGAYTSGLLATKLGLPFAIGFLAGGLTAAVTANLLMLAIARVKGVYFFLVSFGFLGVMDSMFKYWRPITGGVSGLQNIPPIMGLTTVMPYYYIIMTFAALTVFIMYRLDKSRFGAEIMAIGEAEELAEVNGINVFRYRVLAFTIGALFAGFAGSLFAHYSTFIAPATFSMWFTIFILIWVVVGGPQKFWGPVAGTVLMTAITEFLRMSGILQALLYAAILLTVIMVMPRGIVGMVDALRGRLGGRPHPADNDKLR